MYREDIGFQLPVPVVIAHADKIHGFKAELSGEIPFLSKFARFLPDYDAAMPNREIECTYPVAEPVAVNILINDRRIFAFIQFTINNLQRKLREPER